MSDYSILIVDDDPDAIRLQSSLIKTLGYKVSGATRAQDALEFYKNHKPDLVVTDLRMPDLDGLSLLKKIRQFDPKAKVAILTAYGEKETVAQAFRLGAVEFLEKPLRTQDLLEAVDQLVKQEDQALEGDLRMMSLASIIQINCEERNQAYLRLVSEGRDGQIYFSEGEIVHADIGDVVGETAIYEMLGWKAGSFQLKLGISPPERTIHQGWSGLLLEGMRRLDESTAGWSTVWEGEIKAEPSPEDILQPRIARALTSLDEIEGVLICDPSGQILGYSGSRSSDKIAGLVQVLIEQAQKLSELLNGSKPEGLERLVLSGDVSKALLFPYKDNFFYISLTRRASIDAVWQSINRTLKRYRSA